MAHDVFISHSAKDKTTADAVCAMLESDGIRCWIAPRDVLPGLEWGRSIIEAIEQTRIMVLVFTANANVSPQIRREVERAVNHDVVIVPFRTENVVLDRSLEYFIGNVHWLDAITPPLEAHVKNLGTTIKVLLARIGSDESAKRREPDSNEPAKAVAALFSSTPDPLQTPLPQPGASAGSVLTRFSRARVQALLWAASFTLAIMLGFWGYARAGSDFDQYRGFVTAPQYAQFKSDPLLESLRCLFSAIGLIRLDDVFQPGRAPWQLLVAQFAVPGFALVGVGFLVLSALRRATASRGSP
jgi:hypothetical protein